MVDCTHMRALYEKVNLEDVFTDVSQTHSVALRSPITTIPLLSRDSAVLVVKVYMSDSSKAVYLDSGPSLEHT